MKIASFNINDINRRLANLLNWLREAEPHVVCLQELKSTDVEVLPQIAMVSLGRIAPPMRCVALLTHSLAACIRAYGSAGYDGVLCPDHVPFKIDPECERFFAFCLGLTQRHRCRRCDALPTAKTLYRALRIHIERERPWPQAMKRRFLWRLPKAKIGAPLRQRDAANRLALGIEDHHPIEVRAPHSPTGPDIAVHVATKTIRRSGAGIDQHSAGPEMAPITITSNTRILRVGTARDSTT